MAPEPLLISPTQGFSPRSLPSPSPRSAKFVPDQIVTPRSYGASVGENLDHTPHSADGPPSPFSQLSSPLSLNRSNFSPQISTPSPRDNFIPEYHSFNSALLSAPPSLFPLGPLPPNRLRGGNTTTAAGASIKTLERTKTVSIAYVWPVQHRPTIEHDDFTDQEIPTVDMSSLDSKDEDVRKEAVAHVGAACMDWGFFHAVNHGIPLQLLDRVQKQAQRLFALPKEEKLKASKGPGSLIGYGHAATVKPTDTQPWSEGFYLGNDARVDKFSQILWPRGDNKDFGDSYREYNDKVENLAKLLMDVIVEGLEVNPAHFQRYVEKASGLLRWNHYPPCPEPHKAIGMSAHTDYSLMTVLHEGDIGGLQVQKNGNWVAVKPRRDALAINIGDTVQVLTNGFYKSVAHRAVVNRTQARISLAYFFAPPNGVEILPSPEMVDRTNQSSNYKPFTIEEYLDAKKDQVLNTLERFSAQPIMQFLEFPFGKPALMPVESV